MSWLKDCEICNTGLCKAVDARKEGGLSESSNVNRKRENQGKDITMSNNKKVKGKLRFEHVQDLR